MAFSPTHALLAVAMGAVIAPRRALLVFLIAGAACAVLPDVDLMAPLFVSHGREMHRTFTHSILFAIPLGVSMALCTSRLPRGCMKRLTVYLVLATLSHGMLDALTTYEVGVAFLSPVLPTRFVAPWQPIDSASVEFWFVFVPLVLFTAIVLRLRGIRLRWSDRETPLTLRSD